MSTMLAIFLVALAFHYTAYLIMAFASLALLAFEHAASAWIIGILRRSAAPPP